MVRYLGIARRVGDRIVISSEVTGKLEEEQIFEIVEIGGDILLIPAPLDRRRMAYIEKLAKQSIEDHRQTLERLAK